MKRAPRRSNRDERVEELELRLKSMEELMKAHVTDDQSTSNNVSFRDITSRPNPNYTPNQSEFRNEDSSSYTDPASTMASGSIRAWSGISSEESLNRVSTSQAEGLPTVLSSDNNVSQGLAMRTLPPKNTLLKLVKESFQGFYSAYPLFDEARFVSIFDTVDMTIDDPGQWACLNVVLALTSQFQYEAAQDIEELYDPSEYFQTAFALSGPLMTLHVTLWSIQALLGMALIIQGSPTQGPASLLISAAMKLAHIIGLHRQCRNPSISPAEIEERKRVFWIAYSLDKDLSLQMGQPSAQDDDDMDVELPSDDSGTSIFSEQATASSLLNFRARLAMIQGRIYKRLYSAKASKQANAERILAATELESMLHSWRASVPSELIREYQGQRPQMPFSHRTQHPIILQLVYFNSLAMVYQALPAISRYRELPAPGKPIEFRLLTAPLLYAAEARKSIKLLQITPLRRYVCVWAVLYIFVTAATTLLRDIIDNPSASTALPDLKLIQPLITLLDTLAQSPKGRQSERLGGIYQPCKELFERAQLAIHSTDLESVDWDLWITRGPSQEREGAGESSWDLGHDGMRYGGQLDASPGGVSGDFAFAVEQQFQASTSI